MIDTEKNIDSKMENKSTADEPPPYSRRQASTSSTVNHRRLRSSHPPAHRFVAPAPAPSPLPSPRLIISPADQRPSSSDYVFNDDKPVSPKAGMGYTDMDAFNGMGTPYTPESGAGPSRSAGVAGQSRSPIVGSRKGMETVIMIGTGSSGMWLNHIICATKSEPIRGQYYIDPNLEVQDHATARRAGALGLKVHSRSTSSLSTGSKSGKKKADYSWHPTAEPELCNGFFESKNSNIDILLNIGGQGSSKANKANVDVRSRSGKVAIKVTEIAEGRRLNLDTTTMKGDIEVFLPRTFSGPLHVHTEGEITLLPRLAATMEVIQAREDDALVMITSPRPSPSTSPAPSSRSHHDHSHKATGAATSSGGLSSWLHPGGGGGMRAQSYEGDYANLISSSGGNIIVGFLGEDKIKEESPGMWKKIVSLFTGERSNTS